MKTFEKIPINKLNTFGLDYIADRLILTETDNEAVAVLKKYSGERLLILGGGSNLLFTGNFRGTIIKPVMEGIKIEKKEGNNIIVAAGAGVNWDNLVAWTVEKGFSGLENLSYIPGNTGASPVQNIGAYGAEVSEFIEKVETISTTSFSRKTFGRDECGFAYRNSIFKGSEKGRYMVMKVFFRLSAVPKYNLEYGALKEELGKTPITLTGIREAVIAIRKRKLPDPYIIGNAGSFFKNPVVPASVAVLLKEQFPSIPVYPDAPGYTKLAAGWLIEQCGWKGKRFGNAGVHEKQALVLVNLGNASGEEIFDLSEEIKTSVRNKFGIGLEREVEVISSI
jgi:UDP-N-acetylmuramate dehydrogenase